MFSKKKRTPFFKYCSPFFRVHMRYYIAKRVERERAIKYPPLLYEEISKHVYDDDAPAGANGCVQRAKGPN